MNISLRFLTFLCSVCFVQFSFAVNFNLNNIKFGINGYLDAELDAMDKMAMVMDCSVVACSMSGMNLDSGEMMMEMPDSLRLGQNHLNVILSSQTDSIRTNINFESRYSYQSNDRQSGVSANGGESGRFAVAEAYGEYTKNTSLRFRFGSFYTPFGLFNQYRYITPLYATVVLPFIYELPYNYNGELIVPSNSNFMLNGEFISNDNVFSYYFYTGAGKRNTNNESMSDNGVGRESDTDKSVGFRLTYEKEERYKFGTSYYQVLDQDEDFKQTYGIDIDLTLPRDFRLQSEYAILKSKLDKRSYYLRLSYEGSEKFNPFIMFDYFVDESNPLYKFEQNRVGIGTSYNVEQNFILKIEYHYHYWGDRPVATGSSGMMTMNSKAPQYNNMLRAAAIFSF